MLKIISKLKKIFFAGRASSNLIDSRHITDDIHFLQNKSRYLGVSPIVILTIETCVTLPSFRLSKENRHPFIDALWALSRDDITYDSGLKFLKSKMKIFYDDFQPNNAFDLLGLAPDKDHILKNFEPYALTLPWDNADPKKERRAKQKSIRDENSVLKVIAGVDAGWAWSGPVSSEKLEVEALRLFNVYRSIQRNGYCRNNTPDGDIRVNLLFDESYKNATWQTRVGQHRAIALAGLGYERITCRVSKIVIRSEVDKWPNVRNGTYDRQLALDVFDKTFLLGQNSPA